MSNRATPPARDKLAAELQELRDRLKALEAPQARTRGLVQFGPQIQVGDFILEQVTLPADARYPTIPQFRVRNSKTGFSAKLPIGAFAQQVIVPANRTVTVGTQAAPGLVDSAMVVSIPQRPAATIWRVDWSAWVSASVTGWGTVGVGTYVSAPNQGITNGILLGAVAVLSDSGAAVQGSTISQGGFFSTSGYTFPLTIALGYYKQINAGTVVIAGSHSTMRVQEVA